MANRPSRLLILILAPALGFGLLLGWLSAEFTSSRIEQAELELAEKLLARVETNIQPFLDRSIPFLYKSYWMSTPARCLMPQSH